MRHSGWLTARALCVLLAAIVLGGCASAPIESVQPISSLSVAQARATLTDNDSAKAIDEGPLLWGGVILNVENLAGATQVEIMGYPLDRRQRPLTAKDAQGRFIARYDGFVEPLKLPVGRAVTVLGPMLVPISGKVGEADYLYPVVGVEQAHLWREQDLPVRTGFTFGIGISLSN